MWYQGVCLLMPVLTMINPYTAKNDWVLTWKTYWLLWFLQTPKLEWQTHCQRFVAWFPETAIITWHRSPQPFSILLKKVFCCSLFPNGQIFPLDKKLEKISPMGSQTKNKRKSHTIQGKKKWFYWALNLNSEINKYYLNTRALCILH